MMRLLLPASPLSRCSPAALGAQSLEERVRGPHGTVRMSYPARSGVCGNGTNFSRRDGDSGLGVDVRPPGGAGGPAGPGRRVTEVRTYVGGRWRPAARQPTSGPSAPRRPRLLPRARRTGSDLMGDPVLPAALADSVTLWPSLLRAGPHVPTAGRPAAHSHILAGSGRRRRSNAGPSTRLRPIAQQPGGSETGGLCPLPAPRARVCRPSSASPAATPTPSLERPPCSGSVRAKIRELSICSRKSCGRLATLSPVAPSKPRTVQARGTPSRSARPFNRLTEVGCERPSHHSLALSGAHGLSGAAARAIPPAPSFRGPLPFSVPGRGVGNSGWCSGRGGLDRSHTGERLHPARARRGRARHRADRGPGHL